MSEPKNIASLINTWQTIIQCEQKTWVLFENGTCLILTEPQQDLATQAKAIMSEWGPVYYGSCSGNFIVINLLNCPGWVVTGDHPDLLSYVSPDEFEEDEPSDFIIGLRGKKKQDADAKYLKIIYIEDKR